MLAMRPAVETAHVASIVLVLARRVRDAARRVREQVAKDVPEEEERDDDGDREEAEQNRVLGRRLAILTLPQLGTATCRRTNGRIRMSVMWRFLLLSWGGGVRPCG